MALLLLIPAAWLVISMVVDQIESQNRHNSVFQRASGPARCTTSGESRRSSGTDSATGYNPGELPDQPPQAEFEVLASAGVVGLIGFLVMWIGVLVVLWHVDPRFGTLAVAVLLSRFVQSQFDLFWVAVQVSLPICGRRHLSGRDGSRAENEGGDG